MSVINRVLRDLDRRGGQAMPPAPGVQGARARAPSRAPFRLPLAAGLALAVATAWWIWPAPTTPPHAPVPAGPEDLEARIEAPMEAPAGVEPPAPRLRMSRELGAGPPPLRPDTPSTPARGPDADVTVPPGAVTPPPPQTVSASSGIATRLETRLPEPPAGSRPAVVKEMKPRTAAEEADELWRQAARLLELGRARDARERLEQALGLDPAHLHARQNLVVLALEDGRRAAAEALLREGMALHPADFWFPRSLAQTHLQQGEADQAASLLKKALGRDSAAADWGLYAGTLAKLGRPEDAAAAYREALRREASHGAWWIGLGLALEQSGQINEARDAFARALQTRLNTELRDFAARKAQ